MANRTGTGSKGNRTLLGFDRQRPEPLGSFGSHGNKRKFVRRTAKSIESNLAAGQIAMRLMDREIFNWLDEMGLFATITALKILDRWALNSPEKLKELEKEGNGGALFNRFAGQVEQELEAKETERYWDLIDSGLSHWEALELMGINVNL